MEVFSVLIELDVNRSEIIATRQKFTYFIKNILVNTRALPVLHALGKALSLYRPFAKGLIFFGRKITAVFFNRKLFTLKKHFQMLTKV